jgi:hypothetical protein
MKEDLWENEKCPEWFERSREDFPNPRIRIYYNSNLFGPTFSMGFDLEKGEYWNRRGILIEFLQVIQKGGGGISATLGAI